MRVFVIGLVILLVLFGAGILGFRNSDDKINITIDKQELKNQTEKVVEKTKDIGSSMVDKAESMFKKNPNAPADSPSPDAQRSAQRQPAQNPSTNR